jgi:hypothetical protein
MFKGVLDDWYLQKAIAYIGQRFDVNKKKFHPVYRPAPGRIAGKAGEYIQIAGEQIDIQGLAVVMGAPTDNVINPVERIYAGGYTPTYTDCFIAETLVG